jgi:hypothetical protein
MKFLFQKEIQEEYQLPIYLEKWIQQYHKNVYELHEREDIHKSGYEKDISILRFFKNHIFINESFGNASPNLTNTITQGVILLSFLIILFICGIFLYFKIENKHYLFIFMILLSMKLPLLLQRFYQDLIQTIPHVSEFYSGELIYEENEIIQWPQDEILYLPITPSLWKYEERPYLQSSFPILNSILQNSKPVLGCWKEYLEYEISQNPFKKKIVPILTLSSMFNETPSHFQWIDLLQQEISFFTNRSTLKIQTILGRPIEIDQKEDFYFEMERLFQKYNQK